jgi:hypothetical protein
MHRCQEKNARRVEKWSTIFLAPDRGSSANLDSRERFRSASKRDFGFFGGAMEQNHAASAAASVSSHRHSVTFKAKPAGDDLVQAGETRGRR